MNWIEKVNWTALATILAIIVGPILAVVFTRWLDDRRLAHQRQWDVFRTLMRTRAVGLNVDHVGALNLIEVEFADHPQVVQAWKNLLADFAASFPTDPEEQRRRGEHRQLLLAKLLDAMARSLGIAIEQLDIFRGGYVPQGWLDDENAQRQFRQKLNEMLQGRRGFPVEVFQPPDPTKPK